MNWRKIFSRLLLIILYRFLLPTFTFVINLEKNQMAWMTLTRNCTDYVGMCTHSKWLKVSSEGSGALSVLSTGRVCMIP